ncbi:hypothetical protein V1514DRAFT_310388 [Lipomyces japonicus]|uniref:uncharacterized protein n=1 Tax=Lipomyces japonicus TaxID=56871 RepID=UPI0034CF1F50
MVTSAPAESNGNNTITAAPAATAESKPGTTADLQRQQANTVHDVLPYVKLKTGLCYDVRMRYHAKIVTNAYDYMDPHPEDPRRVYRIYKALAEAGLVDMKGASGAAKIGSDLMKHIRAREATKEEVELNHEHQHWEYIERTKTMTHDELKDATEKGDSVYFNNESFFCAKLSCGGVIDTCKAVVEQKVKNAIAVVRPPGHHAEPYKPAGFCMFNNVAVASKVILKQYPEQVKRIFILDWDIHHGNGTQRAFYDDPNVLYISLHRYDNGRFYPGGDFGNYDKCGQGAGLGTTVNIPWPCGGMQDGDYIYAFQRVVMPIAQEFNPDLVILSAGFDAAPGDELGECFVSPAAYGHMTHMLKSLANGKLAVILEGGYNLDSIATSALGVTKVLIGDAPAPLTHTFAKPEAVETIEKVMRAQANYWKQMAIGHKVHDQPGAPATERLHDVIRAYQADRLFADYQMTSLPIFRDRLSKSFQDQVLCTPGFQSARTIVVIVHDPPELWCEPDPVNGRIELHDTYVADGVLKYIDWAVSRNFGVVDVNAPHLFTDQEDDNVQTTLQDLCIYIWDNYLDLSDAKSIVFLGVGDGCAGMIYLLGHREVRDRVRSAVAFAGNSPLYALVPIMDEFIMDWYGKNSLVLTCKYHPVWDPKSSGGGGNKNPRKKYGNVQKTEWDNINDLMVEEFDRVKEFVYEDFDDGSEDINNKNGSTGSSNNHSNNSTKAEGVVPMDES